MCVAWRATCATESPKGRPAPSFRPGVQPTVRCRADGLIVARMRIHRSNRVEALLSVLARIVAHPLADPFAPEWIVVQGPGMERWLSLELSRELGGDVEDEKQFDAGIEF